ncbi:MAG: DNA replication and repair protein RecF [Ignavibacteriaceae bacterium]|nr:DNA replication and repair protein RecF [Ignavibacteriaceae bacterium]
MILTSLRLKNFRCHKEVLLNFSENLNYIVGGNGLGKTAILESIYFLCTTKSQITSSDKEVVNFGEIGFEVYGSFSNQVTDEVSVVFTSETNKKNYYQNQKLKHRLSDIIGNFPIVILTPADHQITMGYSADRRKFIDSIYCQASRTYFKLLLDYNRTVKQRAALLNGMKENKFNKANELDAWTEKLIESGSELICYRKKFFSELETYVKQAYFEILNDRETPSLKYFYLSGYEGDNIKKHFTDLIEKFKNEELRRGTCLVGPHKDDFVFEINNINLRTFGSQGQHKTFQVALRFAEFFYLKEKTGKTPIFLLDDVFGELDTKRAVRISENLRKVGQTFITLTDFTNLSYLQRQNSDVVIKLDKSGITYA